MKKFPTRFDGYYVTEDGRIFTEWNKYGKKEYLREVNQFNRGGGLKNKIGGCYKAINMSLKNKDGKNIKQIKYYTHRLIAETFIENPNNYKEIDHLDRNKFNNSVDNLRWCDRIENMSWNKKL